MRKRVFAMAAAVLLLLGACLAEGERASLAQLNSPAAVIGVNQGSAAERIVQAELPKAGLAYFLDNQTAYLAVAQGKIDAYAYDLNQMRFAIAQGVSGVRLLDEHLGDPVRVAVGISPVPSIPDLEARLNQFIGEIRADGTLDDMFRRWVLAGDESMPAIAAPENPDLHLTVGTSGIVPPFSYYAGASLTGFDIEMAYRFAAWLGASVQFKVYDYGAIVPAAVSGDVDCIMANLNITEERREALAFSDVLYEETVGLMVRGGQTSPGSFNGQRAGVITGSFHDSVIAQALPDSPVSQYGSYTDMTAALETGKIDYFLASREVARSLTEENKALQTLQEPVQVLDIGAAFAKNERGDTLKKQMDAFIERLKTEGTLKEIYDFWSDPANASVPVDMSGLTGENGTLQFATSGTKAPISFVANGQIAGADPDIAVRFCREYGYGIQAHIVDTAGIIPGIVTGMYDFSLSDLVITDERKESVSFSAPYHVTELLMVTRADNDAASAAETSVWESIAASFHKTFIREGRWKLFLEGVLISMLITLLSVLFGTVLGFLVFLLCRNGNPLANGVARFSMWLVQGMPMVVLLMILYYVIFGSVAISGIAVAVIGFTLTFGAAVFGLIKMGVGTIDRGQYEAAYALGHSNAHTFFKIILPQAIPHVLPAYQGEIVGLIKATAIVGYIAVQDLTKMGDIVRSRTYEAFFPLIAVTVIYFVLEGLLSFGVSRIRLGIDPRKRRPERVLRGISFGDEGRGT